MPKYSVIIPVYNRPQEIDELLYSLTEINYTDFEIIVIEDGSSIPSEQICLGYQKKMPLSYQYQENKGPGPARNHGATLAKGKILVFFDSDCIIPKEYFNEVDKYIEKIDCYGGPDMAHESFNTIQKAINYSMTSTLTTGGIRGGKKQLDHFYPRSFNFGIKTDIFQKLNGFADLRFGEDLDLSMRIIKNGYKSMLIKKAAVYHKRRNNFKTFFKQVYNSGIARIHLNYRHPGSLKILHLIPTLFTLGYLLLIIASIVFPYLIYLVLLPVLVFFLDALIKTGNIKVSATACISTLIQLSGYGLGLFLAALKRKILNKKEFYAYEENFYE
jgi:glycosyltransferase involved in cell wall biosynthesis